MKKTYLILTVIGFIAPNFLVFMESMETGNFLLYANPIATIDGMFANRISSIFAIDLFIAVLVFFIWSYRESKILEIKGIVIIYALTMLFGLGGGFPLYLYLRERAKSE